MNGLEDGGWPVAGDSWKSEKSSTSSSNDGLAGGGGVPETDLCDVIDPIRKCASGGGLPPVRPSPVGVVFPGVEPRDEMEKDLTRGLDDVGTVAEERKSENSSSSSLSVLLCRSNESAGLGGAEGLAGTDGGGVVVDCLGTAGGGTGAGGTDGCREGGGGGMSGGDADVGLGGAGGGASRGGRALPNPGGTDGGMKELDPWAREAGLDVVVLSACDRYASGYSWARGIDDVGVSGGFASPSDAETLARGGGNDGGMDLEDEASSTAPCMTGGVNERANSLRELRTTGTGVCEREDGGEGKKNGCGGVAFLSTVNGEGLVDRAPLLDKATVGVEGLDG